MRAALRRQPGPDVAPAVQRMFERWLRDEPLDPDRMSYAELEELAQLYDWGIAADPGLPPLRPGRAGPRHGGPAVAMFEHLVGPDFVGRAAALRHPETGYVDGGHGATDRC